MLRLFLASHGSIASGIKSSVNILLGKSGNLTIFDAYLDERNLKDELEEFFQSVPDGDQVILLSDLYGGSVNQVMYSYLTKPNTFLVAGINLALVLDLSLRDKPVTEAELRDIICQSKEALQLVELTPTITKEDDFFEE